MQIFCFEIFTPSKIMQGISGIKRTKNFSLSTRSIFQRQKFYFLQLKRGQRQMELFASDMMNRITE